MVANIFALSCMLAECNSRSGQWWRLSCGQGCLPCWGCWRYPAVGWRGLLHGSLGCWVCGPHSPPSGCFLLWLSDSSLGDPNLIVRSDRLQRQMKYLKPKKIWEYNFVWIIYFHIEQNKLITSSDYTIWAPIFKSHTNFTDVGQKKPGRTQVAVCVWQLLSPNNLETHPDKVLECPRPHTFSRNLICSSSLTGSTTSP